MDPAAVSVPGELPRLFSLTFHLPEFAQAWQHCDSLANFLGKAVSSDKKDSFRYGNLLSTVINEVLESLYHHHGSGDYAELEVGGEGPWLEFSVRLAPDEATAAFYEAVERTLSSGDVAMRYEQVLLDHEDQPPGQAGLLEIAASYDAQIRVQRDSESFLKIAVALNMDRLLEE